jgi:hypothetical protein
MLSNEWTQHHSIDLDKPDQELSHVVPLLLYSASANQCFFNAAKIF